MFIYTCDWLYSSMIWFYAVRKSITSLCHACSIIKLIYKNWVTSSLSYPYHVWEKVSRKFKGIACKREWTLYLLIWQGSLLCLWEKSLTAFVKFEQLYLIIKFYYQFSDTRPQCASQRNSHIKRNTMHGVLAFQHFGVLNTGFSTENSSKRRLWPSIGPWKSVVMVTRPMRAANSVYRCVRINAYTASVLPLTLALATMDTEGPLVIYVSKHAFNSFKSFLIWRTFGESGLRVNQKGYQGESSLVLIQSGWPELKEVETTIN